MKDKTDVELIAKAEHRAGYFADNEMTLDDGHGLAIELASRLKAANEKLARLERKLEDLRPLVEREIEFQETGK